MGESERPLTDARMELTQMALNVLREESIEGWQDLDPSDAYKIEVVDMLANLRHWCMRHGLAFEALDLRARDHFVAERMMISDAEKASLIARGFVVGRYRQRWRFVLNGLPSTARFKTEGEAWRELVATVAAADAKRAAKSAAPA